ncbi:MAG: DegV family protein [Clostridiales bacterium]|nr:DegV family protein [Clostridiales bacterium]
MDRKTKNNIIISMEATCDLNSEIIKENDFRIIDMNFLIDSREFSTKEHDVVTSNLYGNMRAGAKTSTSQINQIVYEEYFSKLLSEGKDVLHLAFSSGLSQTCQSAINASENVNKNFKNKVYVIDSLCACAGQGLLGLVAKKFIDDGGDIKGAVEYLEKIKMNISHLFSVDNLKYLANGGRIKKTSAIVGNVLHIKPVMKADDQGKLVVMQKVMSRKKALKELLNIYNETYDDNYKFCIISHADCLEDAEFIRENIKALKGVDSVITNLGPIIGSHSGPGTIAFFFVSKFNR